MRCDKNRFLTADEKEAIVRAYSVGLVSMADLVVQYHRSLNAIWKTIKAAGCIRHKNLLVVTCNACSRRFTKRRSITRPGHKHYCNQVCYKHHRGCVVQ